MNTFNDAQHDAVCDELEALEAKYAELVAKLNALRFAWEWYRGYLMKKYPSTDGREWHFTCPHHNKIQEILDSIEELRGDL